jgi:hypothetical protein
MSSVTSVALTDLNWVGLQSLVQVERISIRQGEPYQQTNYYISSLVSSAVEFHKGFARTRGLRTVCIELKM